MLKIRLSRTGKTRQPSYRLVVAPKSAGVKRKFVEILGHYLPAREPEILEFKKERIEYWISKGAQPSDRVAVLLKNKGLANMDKFILPGNRKRKKKGEEEKAPSAPKAATAVAPAPKAEAPKSETQPAS